MKLHFVKRIDTTKDSIFYSLAQYKNKLLGFGRTHYRSRMIKQIILDENFDVIEDANILFKGEDPRCFEHKNNLYIQDNYLNDMFLIDYENQQYTKIDISGKNISFINHDNVLYFIHYIKPFKLYRFDIESKSITKVIVDDDDCTYNYEYRGGTPGYKLNNNKYYGFGHRTYHKNGLKHDIFKWVVDFDKIPKITIIDIEQPSSKSICDPTSVIEINNRKYLITAETDNAWFHSQDYITNVYEIIE